MTEITRDANRMGNALRTISLRIRGLDEETGLADDGLKTISNDIANLTGKPISLFEDDGSTYRSTYDILHDISEVWGEIDDKSKAALTESLAGKTRANELSAVLSNFETAEGVIEKTADSAGNADAEFKKASQGIAFKLNTLKETVTGVFQNLFNTDGMKMAVDGLSVVMGGIESLTGVIGAASPAILTFGAALAGIKIDNLLGITKIMSSMGNAISNKGIGGKPKLFGFKELLCHHRVDRKVYKIEYYRGL